jgi:hypothetical protein
MGETYALILDTRNIHRIVVRKPQEKRAHRTSMSRWEDNIKIGIKLTEFECVGWVKLPDNMVTDGLL